MTFAMFITPQGVVAAASLVTLLVQLIKTVFPLIDARVSGALMAFALTAVLYVLTAIATGPATWDGYLILFAAWLSCATSAVGIKAASDHVAAANIGGDA